MQSTQTVAAYEVDPALRELLDSGDRESFEAALDTLIRGREQHLFHSLGCLARDLHDSVRRLAADISSDGVPGSMGDARRHLRDVIDMSSQAAHRTLDFADKLRPQARELSAEADALLAEEVHDEVFASQATALAIGVGDFTQALDIGIGDMVEAQSWQDLSGQRVAQVEAFMGKVESSLLELVRLTGTLAGGGHAAKADKVGQDEVDRLLSEFGF